ncbi:MAG: kelch repeat-containing protein [Planctomycetota bacterium]
MRQTISAALALACCGAALADCIWYPGPSFSQPRTAFAAVDQAGTLVAIGGRPLAGQGSAVHYLPPGAAAWQSGVPLVEPVQQPAAGIDGAGRIILTGGYVTSDHPPFFIPLINGYVYDLQLGEVDTIADMTYARAWVAFTDDAAHRLYVIGGMDVNRQATVYVERYDASQNQWSVLAPLPEARVHAAAASDGAGRVLVIGGQDAAGTAVRTVFAYEIANDRWTPVAPLPVALHSHGAALGANGHVYAFGGMGPTGTSAATYIYDPATNQWTNGPALPAARSAPGAALRGDGCVYALGGVIGASGSAAVTCLDTLPAGPGHDCNNNGIPDDCDIASGFSSDFNHNGVPDECEGLGDLNCDDAVDFGDINPFVLALADPAGYAAQFPACNILRGDCNGDGRVDFGDINVFIALLQY